MDHWTLPRVRVALSATPPLLADSLRVLLADERTDVTLIVDTGCDRYDVALVTPGAPPIDAHVTIELDTDPQTRGGGVLRHGPLVQYLADIHEVVAAVHGLHPDTETAR